MEVYRIRQERQKRGLTVRQLAQLTGIPYPHISEMERGKRHVEREQVAILERVFEIDHLPHDHT